MAIPLSQRVADHELSEDQARRNLVESMRQRAVETRGKELTDEQLEALIEKMKQEGIPLQGEGGGERRG